MAADQVGQRLDARDAHLLTSPVLSSASSHTDNSPDQSVSSAAIQSAVSAVPCQKTRSALELIWSSMNVQRTTLAHDRCEGRLADQATGHQFQRRRV